MFSFLNNDYNWHVFVATYLGEIDVQRSNLDADYDQQCVFRRLLGWGLKFVFSRSEKSLETVKAFNKLGLIIWV